MTGNKQQQQRPKQKNESRQTPEITCHPQNCADVDVVVSFPQLNDNNKTCEFANSEIPN